MKRIIACFALLALVGISRADNVTNLVTDGDFESPNGDVGPWANMFGGDSISFLSTGGNPDGCLQIIDSQSYGGVAYVNPPAQTLTSLGLVAGQTYTFLMDMQIVGGVNIGGLKLESWNDNNIISDSGNMYPLSSNVNWMTYSFTYKIANGATHLNVVPLWGPNSTVNYDNIRVVVAGVTPLSVAITDPTNNQAIGPNFTIRANATVSPGSVTNVAFYVDNALVGNATSSPYGFIESGLAVGAHALKAVAMANSGNMATSSVVNITVTNATTAPFTGAYEPFNYTSISSGVPTTGTGFGGTWSCGTEGTIVTGLTYPGLAATGYALQSSSFYQLESLSTVPSGLSNVWVSFIFKQSGDNGGNRDGFALEDSSGKGVMFAYHQNQATIGFPALTAVNSFTAVVPGSLNPFSAVAQTYNANNFYVLKLTYSGGSLSSVAVYTNPTAGQGTIPNPDFTVTSGLSGIGVLSTLGIVHQAGTQITVDEVRVGTTFADVVGANLKPTIPTTLGLTVTSGKQISWTASATNYYQPQSSSDGANWNNLGNMLYGTNVTSLFDFAPSAYYQVEEILPTPMEVLANGDFEMGDGFGGAAYWQGGGSQPPAYTITDAHSGTASMMLLVTNAASAAQTCDLQQTLSSSGGGVTGGTSYQFSFWAKSLGRNPAGGYVQRYKLTWLDGANVALGGIGFTDFIGGTNSWRQINAGLVTAPTNAVNATIEIYTTTGGILNDYGGVLIDDMSLMGSSPSSTINVLPAVVRDAAQFNATLTANSGPVAPSGTITFKTNNVQQSSVPLDNNAGTSAPAIVPASYVVTAIYSGDATYYPSTNTLVIGTGVNPVPAPIVTSVSGNQLTLSWPSDHTGWTLQSQTNALGGTWYDVPGSVSVNQIVLTINPTNKAVFFRMKY